MQLEVPPEDRWKLNVDPEHAQSESEHAGQEQPKRGNAGAFEQDHLDNSPAAEADCSHHAEFSCPGINACRQRIANPDHYKNKRDQLHYVCNTERLPHLIGEVLDHRLTVKHSKTVGAAEISSDGAATVSVSLPVSTAT